MRSRFEHEVLKTHHRLSPQRTSFLVESDCIFNLVNSPYLQVILQIFQLGYLPGFDAKLNNKSGVRHLKLVRAEVRQRRRESILFINLN